MSELSIKNIEINNEASFICLDWNDGKKDTIDIVRLRGYCPCASCQKYHRELQYVENKVGSIEAARPIGRYAIGFKFADGHDTGIYTFDYLRKLASKEIPEKGAH